LEWREAKRLEMKGKEEKRWGKSKTMQRAQQTAELFKTERTQVEMVVRRGWR
jgi:hypothetical protein